MKIKTATARVVYDRRKVASTTHDGSVEIEVSFNGKRKWLPTGVRVRKDQWYNKRGVFVTNRIDSKELNTRIGEALAKVQAEINRLGDSFAFDALADKEQNMTFLDFMIDQINSRTDIRPMTVRQHRCAYYFLKNYGKIVRFEDLTRKNIVLLDEYLHKVYSNQTTIHGYHKRIKIYVQRAIEHELLSVNPYATFRTPDGREGTIKYLTEDEVGKIKNAVITSAYIDRARDLFIFQCYTGMAYADVCQFDFSKAEQRQGGWFYRDERLKTREQYSQMILPDAMAILKKYDYRLPTISLQKYNQFLKSVGRCAGLDKVLTSHMGRHTFATMVLNKGVSVEIAAKMLGHAQIKTTQRYAKVLAKSVEDAYKTLLK